MHRVMKTHFSDVGIELKLGEHPLLENVSWQRSELTILLKVHPIGSAWRIHFRSVIGVKVLNERDMPEYWSVNAEAAPKTRCAVSRVQQGGWSRQIWPEPKIRELIYEGVSEFLISGEDYCAVILSYEMPEVCELPSST